MIMQMKEKMIDGWMNRLKKHVLLAFFTLLLALPSVAQTVVSGEVKDSQGTPLVGVTITLKGTTVGTTSDGEGKFNLQAPSSGTLLFTMVGYQAKEISFAQQTVLSVVLQETAELVDEVVVVGYNVVKRSDLTGSITSIGAEEITAMPVTNSLQAL